MGGATTSRSSSSASVDAGDSDGVGFAGVVAGACVGGACWRVAAIGGFAGSVGAEGDSAAVGVSGIEATAEVAAVASAARVRVMIGRSDARGREPPGVVAANVTLPTTSSAAVIPRSTRAVWFENMITLSLMCRTRVHQTADPAHEYTSFLARRNLVHVISVVVSVIHVVSVVVDLRGLVGFLDVVVII